MDQCVYGSIKYLLNTHVKEPTSAHIMPIMSISGFSVKFSIWMIPSLIVSATPEPNKSAPKNSVKQATMQACPRDKDPDDTEVAKELATSLAPIPYASIKAATMVMPNIQVKSYGCIILGYECDAAVVERGEKVTEKEKKTMDDLSV